MTLPFNDRYVSYQPVVDTTDFVVDFPIFGAAEVQVFIDGVETTAFSVTATFTYGKASDAVVILDTAVSNVTVEIYGATVPVRSEDLVGNTNMVSVLQASLERMTAAQQENLRDTTRSLKGDVGASFLIGNMSIGQVLMKTGPMTFGAGPDATDITLAQGYAAAAGVAQTGAEDAATDAQTYSDQAIASLVAVLVELENRVRISQDVVGVGYLAGGGFLTGAQLQILANVATATLINAPDATINNTLVPAPELNKLGLPVYLAQVDLSATGAAQARLNFPANGTRYSHFRVLCHDVSFPDDGQSLILTLATGGNLKLGASDYGYASSRQGASDVVSAGSDGIALNNVGVGNATGEGCAFIIDIMNPHPAALRTQVMWTGVSTSTAGLVRRESGSGSEVAASAVDGLRIRTADGAAMNGIFTLVGYRKAAS